MRIGTIAARELPAYLLSPAGYVVTALFLLITGFLFAFAGFEQGQTASLRPTFDVITWVLLFICPAVAMRTISEEFRSGTFEALMTAPVTEAEVIMGKFLGSAAFLILMLLPTGIYVVALELYGRPDYGELLCGYLGVILAGAAYLAAGILASTLTSSQVVAFLVSVFFWVALVFSTKLLPARLDDNWAELVRALDPDLRLGNFSIGLLDTSDVVYFLSMTALFLTAAVKSLQVRRLR
ncbi:MAG: ABC transporter permease subunit [Planctomycetes bacterium]|nr:ABC transporter permease subunit [Planctomycetota bacterium]